MPKLSHKEHWDVVHLAEQKQLERSEARPATRAIRRLLGEHFLHKLSAYDEYFLWNVIFRRYLPAQMPAAKVVEIGSAPGEFLVRFALRYGCVPYGIEYSETGAQLNRNMFSRSGFDPENVIQSDFFSGEVLEQYAERFDVVISRGFIEHFTDVPSVLDRHMRLLVPGGLLIVSIPNLRGLNYALARLLDKEVVAQHNLEIMRKRTFSRLFDRKDLEPAFCDYYGTFSLCLFTAKPSMLSRYALKTAHKAQPLLNVVFQMILRDNGAESSLLSPCLLFIGNKR